MNRAQILKPVALMVGVALTSLGSAWAVTTPDETRVSGDAKTQPKAKQAHKTKSEKQVKLQKVSAETSVSSSAAPNVPQTQPLASRETPMAVAPVDASKSKTEPVARTVPVATAAPAATAAATAAAAPVRSGNPYLGTPYLPNAAPAQSGSYNTATPVTNPLKGLADLLPSRGEGSSLLPSITTVYPTGEKPLKVVTFKCPTEMLGVQPPPMKLLHEAVNLGMDGINRTNLLSFNLQQVCQ